MDYNELIEMINSLSDKELQQILNRVEISQTQAGFEKSPSHLDYFLDKGKEGLADEGIYGNLDKGVSGDVDYLSSQIFDDYYTHPSIVRNLEGMFAPSNITDPVKPLRHSEDIMPHIMNPTPGGRTWTGFIMDKLYDLSSERGGQTEVVGNIPPGKRAGEYYGVSGDIGATTLPNAHLQIDGLMEQNDLMNLLSNMTEKGDLLEQLALQLQNQGNFSGYETEAIEGIDY